ncbi:armadillo repeat protein [Moniliophthora roreri]|nr:armadillo repeat protein [Moniliophthora roreri]
MGKSQKKKAIRRHNPMRVPDSHLPKGLAAASSTSSKNEAILPIIQKMNSVDASERKWACVAVSNLIQNDSSTRRLLQGKNVVGELITRLTDGEEEVVLEATGALRNLCIDGGYNICAEMYNKNILVPLKTFVPKISQVLSQHLESPKDAPENAKKLMYEFADNVITIMWCLSETSNKALNAINDTSLIPFLMSFLISREKLSISPVLSAAQCLYVLTDDNEPATSHVRSDASYTSCLLSIARPNDKGPNVNGKKKAADDYRTITLRILVSGILRNICPLPPPIAGSDVDIDREIVLPLLQPVISSISLQDVAGTAQRLVDSIASEPPMEKLSLKNVPKSDHKSSYEMELDQLEGKLRSIQLALEILTGACATLPDSTTDMLEDDDTGGDDDEMDDDGDKEELGDAGMDVEMTGDKEDTDSSEQNLFLPSLVPSLLSLIHPTALSFPPLAAPSPHPPTTSALSAIHVSAMECLNNIFLSLATSRNATVAADKDGGRKVWNDIWAALAVVGTESGLGQERRQELWEIAVGVLWGLGIVYKGSITATEEQINVLIQFCGATSDDRIKVKCIGTLECIAQHPDSIEANKVISEFLMSLLPTSTSSSPVGTEPLIQTVSALIDIYSDETLPYDVNFRKGNMLQKLVASVEGVKKAVRCIDRRKEGSRDLRRRGDEVRENLVAFIQYRRELRL